MTYSDISASSSVLGQFDVLVVGAGAAGLYTALCLPKTLRVGLISKDVLSLSASDWAQGGIAVALAPDDSTDLHIQDTLAAGAGLCDLEAVQFLVDHAPACIQSLLDMGVAFDRQGGELALTLEAAHSRRRVLHAADTTGRAVVSTLAAQVLKRQNIKIVSPAFALDLWLDSTTGHCQGISLIYQGHIYWVRSSSVILATGGGGQVFSQTTNPAVSTGDGVAMAWRAGAILRDLEFVQFHPTALSKVGAPRFLISEAVRGEGAYLVDSKGYRFTFDYHPSGELAPRDVVSRAIYSHLQRTGEPHVWLDLRPISPEQIRYRFPNIIQVCQKWGIDVFKEPVPVAPAAHYWMGGIVTDTQNRTSIPALYAVGETASTGVHGANRLASNSLLECLVFGAQMAYLNQSGNGQLHKEAENREISIRSSREVGNQKEKGGNAVNIFSDSSVPWSWEAEKAKIEALRNDLPCLVWQSAGICRGQQTLLAAIAQVEIWCEEFAALPLSQILLNLEPHQTVNVSLPPMSLLRTWGETNNLLDIGILILKSAAFRTESRGGHYRLDYPHSEPSWQTHTFVQNHHWWRASSFSKPYPED